MTAPNDRGILAAVPCNFFLKLMVNHAEKWVVDAHMPLVYAQFLRVRIYVRAHRTWDLQWQEGDLTNLLFPSFLE